jgi:isocitrate/isopropylmalate dehydrogenase
MMAEFLAWEHEATTMRSAVKSALLKNYLTSDLGGNQRTPEVGDWLAEFVTRCSV